METGDCERLRPHLVDFVVGEMEPSEAQRLNIEGHLASCADCRAVAEELRGTGRALEAVKALDTRLREEVRKSISSRARLEAEKLRAERRSRSRQVAGVGRPVPPAAWVVLVVGTIAVLGLASAATQMGVFAPRPAGRVLGSAGDGLGRDWPKGRELRDGEKIPVPAKGILSLELGDGTRLDLCGPAEVRLAAEGRPLKLNKGRAWLKTVSNLRLEISPLKSLLLASGSEVSLQANPVEGKAVLVAVIRGSASYSASGGSGRVEAGDTLVVDGRSASAKVRASQASETAPWRRRMQVP